MAALDLVSVSPRVTSLRAQRGRFLAAPLSVVSRALLDFSWWSDSPSDAVPPRYVRADATGAGEAGGGGVNTAAGAWTPAGAAVALGGGTGSGFFTPGTRVIYIGDMAGTNFTVSLPSLLHDIRLATSSAAAVVATGSWVATGVNGEYKYSGALLANNRFVVRVDEDKARMVGWHAFASVGNMTAKAVVVATPGTVTIKNVGFAFVEGDVIAHTGSANLIGLTRNTLYYVHPTSGLTFDGTDWVQSVQLGTGRTGTVGAYTVTGLVALTALTGTPRFFSLFSGLQTPRANIPTPGSLLPGQFAFAPWEASPTVYMKPSSGTPASHVYHLEVLSVGEAFRFAAVNNHLLGGTIFGSPTSVLEVTAARCGAWGTKIQAGGDGMIGTLAHGLNMHYCEVDDINGHASISVDITNAECGSRVTRNVFQRTNANKVEWGDAQHIISSPNSFAGYWRGNASQYCGRIYGSEAIPANVATNASVIGFDCTSYTTFFDNYLEMVEGASACAAPSWTLDSNQGVRFNRITGNVFDFRGVVGANVVQCLWKAVVQGTALKPGPHDSNLIDHNLILLGNQTEVATYGPSSVISLKNAQTGGTTRIMQVTLANNVVVGGYGSNSALVVTQDTAAVPAAPVVVSYNNIFACPQLSTGAKNYRDGVAFGTQYTMAQMTTAYGAGSQVLTTDSQVSDLFASNGAPKAAVTGTGKALRPQVDALGVSRLWPPTPGPSEMYGLRPG